MQPLAEILTGISERSVLIMQLQSSVPGFYIYGTCK